MQAFISCSHIIVYPVQRLGSTPLLFTSICHSSSITHPASSPTPSSSFFPFINTHTHLFKHCLSVLHHPKFPLQHQQESTYSTVHKYKQVTEATLCISFITHCRGGLTHQHTTSRAEVGLHINTHTNTHTHTQTKCPYSCQPVCSRWWWTHSFWHCSDLAGRKNQMN